jgi:hypothetical protein
MNIVDILNTTTIFLCAAIIIVAMVAYGYIAKANSSGRLEKNRRWIEQRKRIGIHVLPQKTDQERRLSQFC